MEAENEAENGSELNGIKLSRNSASEHELGN
jgi:hypothetical protein